MLYTWLHMCEQPQQLPPKKLKSSCRSYPLPCLPPFLSLNAINFKLPPKLSSFSKYPDKFILFPCLDVHSLFFPLRLPSFGVCAMCLCKTVSYWLTMPRPDDASDSTHHGLRPTGCCLTPPNWHISLCIANKDCKGESPELSWFIFEQDVNSKCANSCWIFAWSSIISSNMQFHLTCSYIALQIRGYKPWTVRRIWEIHDLFIDINYACT